MSEQVSLSLPLRPLGRTSLLVPPLCWGCAPLGSMPEAFGYSVAEEQALATLRAALASPIGFLDTAAIYGNGESERRIGCVLRELGGLPPGVVVATKADRDPATGDFSGAQMRRSVEGSLRRLGLERLQLVYLHDPEHTTFEQVMAPGGPLEELQQLQREGLIAQLGISGGPITMLCRYVETGAFSAVITHSRYTLLNRAAEPLLALGARRGIAILNAAPYGGGLLVRPEAGARYVYREASLALVARARQLSMLCAAYDVTLPAAALQFSLRDMRITSTIVGVASPEQVMQTLHAAAVTIPDALWAELQAVSVDYDEPK
jgi:D-threo-aldose 1-dehydrogenase